MKAKPAPAILTTLVLLSPARPSFARQDPASDPAPTTGQETRDEAAQDQLEARIVEVVGSVDYAPVGADVLDPKVWKPVENGMRLGPGTQLRTGLRSRCVLLFGEPPDQTVISVRRATLASISDFRRSEDEQRIRIGLGYGAIRGGSSEGTLRSDVVIDSTVATLAKRGTEGFQMEVEPVTGAFRISLARSGLVEAISRLDGSRRFVGVGEYATHENIARMWINQDIFDRAVTFYEVDAVSEADQSFMIEQTTGFSSVAPAGGQVTMMAGQGVDGADVTDGSQDGGDALTELLQMVLIERGPAVRPEGNFGFGPTFRVLAPHREALRYRGFAEHRSRPTGHASRALQRRPLPHFLDH